MTKVNVLEREIMEARIDELRRQVHALERQLVLSNQLGQTDEGPAHDGSPGSDAVPLCVGAG